MDNLPVHSDIPLQFLDFAGFTLKLLSAGFTSVLVTLDLIFTKKKLWKCFEQEDDRLPSKKGNSTFIG